MAQGAIKPRKASAAPASAGRKAKPQPSKKGTRVTKAKKGSAADKMQKKFAAGMVAKTEKLLGERAGHLELIGKGRLKGADKDEAAKKKGGSRNSIDRHITPHLFQEAYLIYQVSHVFIREEETALIHYPRSF
ncbi:uncharacterized protein GGS22DRAFT_188051 [Annulohypoxylon maeteangense]|uniref:uncharacterized protein n=1 Tax=Annulohypoxylon maeteangense TaxID=1927788 RepID=UPI002008DE26|nr:uncharacterized protein GGS22DRAFT_188051 [Annulohypoxylon maeteangense]KAI0885765.1 hypothetical protein GGS22DRAFT_188051 [Annulohypoxylon maeteangense]